MVCGRCRWDVPRDEAREVAAGMRPWARPLSFWVGYFGWKALPDAEAAIEQDRWEMAAGRARNRPKKRPGRMSFSCDGTVT